jgi:AraC-like DNA-binding protein
MYKINIVMTKRVTERKKLDPSETRQAFNDVSIKLLCCRYWVLEEWECFDLSVPFWRIYHNNIAGARILFNNAVTQLTEDIMVIIPPNTSFSTELKSDGNHNNYESISGRKFVKKDNLYAIAQKNRVDHLFIHFSLGFPLDFVKTGINILPCDAHTLRIIKDIQDSCSEDSTFNFSECLRINQLINYALLQLQDNIWKFGTIDQRIFSAMKFIEKHFNDKITNEELADKANMAVNSFARLFKTSTGVSIQQYIIKTKIETACNLMHHSNKTIDEIAYECGFSDRHHFAKIFKKVMNVNPAYYKKRLTMA